ncbi:MAG: hypothetical protein AAGJ18_27000, partial [Bacteroidota bacterium]
VTQIAELAAVEPKMVKKWNKALEEVAVRKVWVDHKDKEQTSDLLKERSTKMVIALGLIPTLSHAIIGKVVDLKEKKVHQILTAQPKKNKKPSTKK